MILTLFLRGVIIGFAIAAPIGPINVLCIRRTLAEGRITGIVSGLGAATADAFYGGVAGFGLTLISRILINQNTWLRFVGGIFLLFLGIRTIFAKPVKHIGSAKVDSLIGAYTSTLLLTLTNPMTVFSYGLLFAGFGVTDIRHGLVSACLLVSGVFIGSTIWWIILSSGVEALRSRLDELELKWVNRIAGIFIMASGLFVLLRLL
jgi:threonine/homoserine/homoserine lactone efflux protein